MKVRGLLNFLNDETNAQDNENGTGNDRYGHSFFKKNK
jgi:hypothetical protein